MPSQFTPSPAPPTSGQAGFARPSPELWSTAANGAKSASNCGGWTRSSMGKMRFLPDWFLKSGANGLPALHVVCAPEACNVRCATKPQLE